MEDKFITDGTKVTDNTQEQKSVELVVSILKTKKDLDMANHNFEFAEKELIDYYAYQIKANKSKLDYLMKKAKEQGIALDMTNEIYLRKNEVV